MEEWRGLPFAPQPGTVLCGVDEVPELGGKEVVLGEGDYAFRIVLLRWSGGIRAFRNRCAHVHIPLNYEPDLFHVLDGDVLMCAHHGAMFHIGSGACFDGPCERSSLTTIPVAVRDGGIVVT
jgi:nitrite reductase/ring-hydroxylating ferredoxin subunit